jgi:hypothetical protein
MIYLNSKEFSWKRLFRAYLERGREALKRFNWAKEQSSRVALFGVEPPRCLLAKGIARSRNFLDFIK